MKMKWEEPRIEVQAFLPNEYVATCWGVACNINPANQYEADHDNNISVIRHRPNYCGLTGHQWLTDSDDDNVAESMSEIRTDGLGTLPCTVYTDETYETERDISTVHVEDYIYWTTTAGSRTWHHQGWVSASTPGHPNRS